MKCMSKWFVMALAVMMVLTLSACGCKHENVAVDAAVAATCTDTGLTEGKHCADCGEIIVAQATIPANGHVEKDVPAAEPTCEEEGHTAGKMCVVCDASLSGAEKIAALGHKWDEATCDAPKTCSVCAKTEGDKLAHDWAAATCDKAKTCKLCEKTDGKALGHKWEEATTEAPKTCSVCKKTSGSKIKTDSRFTTAATKHLQGTWICDVEMTDEMTGLDGFGGTAVRYTMHFGNAGEVTQTISVIDEKDYMQKLTAYTIKTMYDSFAQQGMSKAQADEAMKETYGLDVNDYVEALLKDYDVQAEYDSYTSKEVYYVADDVIYTAISWKANFEESKYTLENGKLTIEGIYVEETGEPLVWKKK